MNKQELLGKEISYIKSEKYRDNAKILINDLPDYFFEIAASSTGKYHPKYALNSGGLLRHTKSAVRMAYELLNDPCIGDKYTSSEKDLMIISLILHDGLKLGVEKSDYTKIDHPILMSNFIKEHKDKLSLSKQELNFIADCIKTHMGPWNTDYMGNEVLEKPKDKYQHFVHMCDYLASRKFIEVEFDQNNNILN